MMIRIKYFCLHHPVGAEATHLENESREGMLRPMDCLGFWRKSSWIFEA